MKLNKNQLILVIKTAIDIYDIDRTQSIDEIAKDVADMTEKSLLEIKQNGVKGYVGKKKGGN